MTANTEKPVKKSYSEPVLKVYGSIETVTLSVGMATAAGDGGSGNNKTH
jgi:hypothetical protein